MSFYTPPSEMTDEQLEYWAAQPSSMDIMQEHNQACAISAELRRRRLTPEEREAEDRRKAQARLIERLEHAKRTIPEYVAFAEVLSVPRTKPAKVTLTAELSFDRQQVTGTIVSLKESRDEYTGETNTKMLLQMEDGNRVFGTIPMNIRTELFGPIPGKFKYTSMWRDHDSEKLFKIKRNVAIGRKLTFKALIEPSSDDPHFGFIKRPSKAELV